MGVVSFDGANDTIKSTSLGSGLSNLSAGNAATILCCVKPPAASDFEGIVYLLSGAGSGTAEFGFTIDADEDLFMDTGAGREVVGTFATNPYMIVITKPAGASVTPKLHWQAGSAGTMTHTNFSGAEGFATAATMLEFGAWQATVDPFGPGHIAVWAAWAAEFTDGQAEECANNWRTSDLYLHSVGTPVSLIEFNTITPVDIGSSGAASLVVSGAVLDAAETFDSWNFDGAGGPAATYPTIKGFERNIFPFRGRVGMRGSRGLSQGAIESAGPMPYGGFERSLFHRLHPVYETQQLLDIVFASETNEAQAFDVDKITVLGVPVTIDSAQALDQDKRVTLNFASEADAAIALALFKSKVLGIATETDVAQSLRVPKLSPATETDTAQALNADKYVVLVPATETDAAQIITFTQDDDRQFITITHASESDVAQAIGAAKRVSLGVATEADAAQLLTLLKSVSLTTATETDAAQALTKFKSVTLGRANESDVAIAITIEGQEVVIVYRYRGPVTIGRF